MPRKPRKPGGLSPEDEAYLARLGAKIAELRSEDYSQDDFAALVDVYRSHMSLVERGKSDLRVTTLRRIARALRIKPSELLALIEDAPEQPVPVSGSPSD